MLRKVKVLQLIWFNFRIYEMERQISTPERYKFPHYEAVCWYAAGRLVTELRDLVSAGTKVPPYIISGARALMSALRQWSIEVFILFEFITQSFKFYEKIRY